MYQEFLKSFKNVKNLGGKAWEHAVTLDYLNTTEIEDCSIHCFHYQQMLECLLKHILETKSELGYYSKSHKLNRLLEQVIGATSFKTDKTKYLHHLVAITVCAEEYRYNYELDCKTYFEMIIISDELLKELIEYEKS